MEWYKFNISSFDLTPRKPNDSLFASIRRTSNIYTNEMHKIMDYPSVFVKSYNLATSTMCLERSETKRNEKIIRFMIMASYFDIWKSWITILTKNIHGYPSKFENWFHNFSKIFPCCSIPTNWVNHQKHLFGTFCFCKWLFFIYVSVITNMCKQEILLITWTFGNMWYSYTYFLISILEIQESTEFFNIFYKYFMTMIKLLTINAI